VEEFVTAWRVAIAQVPPEINETSSDYGKRQAAVRAEVDRAGAKVQGYGF